MFLPWYTTSADDHSTLERSPVWSFVEASILLVAIGVLGLLSRGERRAFHLSGGDGLVLMAAGGWCMFLDFYRQLDKPNIDASRGTVGVSWGIFVAFLFGALLAWAGWRMVRSHASEPVVDGDDPSTAAHRGRPLVRRVTAGPARRRGPRRAPGVLAEPAAAGCAATSAGRSRRGSGTRRPDGQFEGQLSFDEEDFAERARRLSCSAEQQQRQRQRRAGDEDAGDDQRP